MERPVFPKRALITAGMPYGSKELHFGHVGGVFVHADAYARFLKDRIGKDNVIFVSGTDCYGSPIVAKYNSLVEEGKFQGTILDFVKSNHDKQAQTLKDYLIKPSKFAASALGRSGEIHTEYSAEFFHALAKTGALVKLSTKQFYDEKFGTFLNGRQVTGRCPIDGCKSEVGYADECSLGHQYFPEELIAPISTLSGERPILKNVENWYFDLEKYMQFLLKMMDDKDANEGLRKTTSVACREFLKNPIIYTKTEFADEDAYEEYDNEAF
ncbi:MAG: class I tRNA ligase family protein, partial [Clostridia bacterium]|nr:class I tRNA ligase family protein [Clostridia bacterium]